MKRCLSFLGIIIPVIFCYGCAPAILMAGAIGSATIGGAIIYDKRSYKTMTEDHRAYDLAQSKIEADPQIKTSKSHIHVAIFNNVALLVGETSNPEIRQHTYELIKEIPNIKKTYNEITVHPSSSSTNRNAIHDAWLTTKIRTAMLLKPGLHSTNLKVLTEKKVVYLLGKVNHTQRALAINVAQHITGVKKVVTVFENTNE